MALHEGTTEEGTVGKNTDTVDRADLAQRGNRLCRSYLKAQTCVVGGCVAFVVDRAIERANYCRFAVVARHVTKEETGCHDLGAVLTKRSGCNNADTAHGAQSVARSTVRRSIDKLREAVAVCTLRCSRPVGWKSAEVDSDWEVFGVE